MKLDWVGAYFRNRWADDPGLCTPPNSQTRMAEFAGRNPDPCEPLAGRFPEYDRAFLEAIDKAMQILPKARIQSAREWLNIINKEGERVKPLKVNSRFDLNKTLTRLVSETNEYVLNSEPRTPKSQPLELKPAEAKPVRAPGWVQEFNHETGKAPQTGISSLVDTVEEQRAVEKTVAELEARKAARLAAEERKKKWWRLGFVRK